LQVWERAVSRIEGKFLQAAIEIGLAEAIAETLADIDRAIREYPANRGSRHLARLHEQRQSLRHPSLRMTAALVAAICVADPNKTVCIRPAFAALAESHPELRWFYAMLPSAVDNEHRLRKAG